MGRWTGGRWTGWGSLMGRWTGWGPLMGRWTGPGAGIDGATLCMPATGVGRVEGLVGYRASSASFTVGATRLGPGVRAPHPPQNRESGVFSVPQLAQRIPG